MAPSQTDRASWAVGESRRCHHQNWVTRARAKRWASGKAWEKQMSGRGASVSLPSRYSQLGKGTGNREQLPSDKSRGFPTSPGMETTD